MKYNVIIIVTFLITPTLSSFQIHPRERQPININPIINKRPYLINSQSSPLTTQLSNVIEQRQRQRRCPSPLLNNPSPSPPSENSSTFSLDSIITLILSPPASIILGSVGLLIVLADKLNHLDLDSVSSGVRSRSDLLGAFAALAVLLNGISKLDVTSALAERVRLDGIAVQTFFLEGWLPTATMEEVGALLEGVLTATPARTAVLLTRDRGGGDDDNGGSWKVTGYTGIIPPGGVVLPSSTGKTKTPILDRFFKDRATKKETYLPSLQALPGRVEFTYLPKNAQEALLLPCVFSENDNDGRCTVLVLGGDTAKSFTPRDVAWCQVMAKRIGDLESC